MLAVPLYYLGYLVYCVLYPLIVLINWLEAVAGFIYWLIMYIPKLIAYLLFLVLWAIWWVLSLLPWLILELFLWLMGLVGQVVATILLVLVVCAILFFIYTSVHQGAAFTLTVILGLAAIGAALLGINAILAVLMCPAQFTYGAVMGLGSDLVYWRAIATMSYVV